MNQEATQKQKTQTPNNAVTIGSVGPGGGIVFFVDSTGLRGLEARPPAEARAMPWPNAARFIATLVRTLGPGWRLPTIEELQLLYGQKEAVGGFDHDFHWSSSELHGDRAISLVDKTGDAYPLRKRGDACYVRAIRGFSPDDPKLKDIAVTIRPHERVGSTNWHFNLARSLSQNEKDEILQLVKTGPLVPYPTIGREFCVENDKFRVVLDYNESEWQTDEEPDGVWEIIGVTRVSGGGLREQENSANSVQTRTAPEPSANARTGTRAETSTSAASTQSQAKRVTESKPWWKFWS